MSYFTTLPKASLLLLAHAPYLPSLFLALGVVCLVNFCPLGTQVLTANLDGHLLGADESCQGANGFLHLKRSAPPPYLAPSRRDHCSRTSRRLTPTIVALLPLRCGFGRTYTVRCVRVTKFTASLLLLRSCGLISTIPKVGLLLLAQGPYMLFPCSSLCTLCKGLKVEAHQDCSSSRADAPPRPLITASRTLLCPAARPRRPKPPASCRCRPV